MEIYCCTVTPTGDFEVPILKPEKHRAEETLVVWGGHLGLTVSKEDTDGGASPFVLHKMSVV